ncbi:DUF3473 domain-containing protein [Thermococcus sp. LS2]|nr:DUF3473 domain-containing protein [Thermococcus sp. LS2]
MYNALTIDVEHWWCNEFLKKYLPENKKVFIHKTVDIVLSLFEKYNVTTTFFILGDVAEKYPEIVEKIYEKGHEIGSHAYSHEPLYRLTRQEVEDEIKRTNNAIYRITKEKPKGFRAPHASITNKNKWVFEILEKYSFVYDSSIFPVKTNLYGLPNAPLGPYFPSSDDITKNDPNGEILEIPLTAVRIFRFGKYSMNLPVGGGFYLRTYPLWFIERAIRKVQKEGRPFVAYVHPWEFYDNLPKLNVPPWIKFEAYNGTGTSFLGKIESILKKFKNIPLERLVEEI